LRLFDRTDAAIELDARESLLDPLAILLPANVPSFIRHHVVLLPDRCGILSSSHSPSAKAGEAGLRS
jgi:hypothetical protein